MLSAALFTLLAATSSPLAPPPLLEADTRTIDLASKPRRIGFAFEAGVPEGLGASVVLRPWSPVRLQLGGATNGFAAGVRGGVVLSPFSSFLRPTLSVHAGHFTEGDARGLARLTGSLPASAELMLSRVQYDYASAQFGIEIGRPERTSFFIRGGMSKVRARLPGVEAAAQAALGDGSLSATTPVLDLTGPSVQLGFTVFVH